MINGLTSWAKSIILAVIIATILEMILPDGNNKKYIKTIIGVYILFTIISPIISKLNGGDIQIDTQKYEQYFNNQNYTMTSTNVIDMNLDNAYVSSMKSDIKQRLKEKGYETKALEADIELKDEAKYGTIKSLNISLIKVSSNNMVNKIEKVEINISNQQTNNIKDSLSENEKNEIKDYLSQTYSIDKKYINIGG